MTSVENVLETTVESKNLERRAGIEPAYTGFADLRVNRFATGAIRIIGYFFPLSLKFSAK
jgi:hypothetical protein